MKIEVKYIFDSEAEFRSHMTGAAESAPSAPARPAAPSAPARPAAPSAPGAPKARTRRTDAQLRDAILNALADNPHGLDVKMLARIIETNPVTTQTKLDTMGADGEVLTDGSIYWLAEAANIEAENVADPDDFAVIGEYDADLG
jgi:hypothetical protein